MPTFIELIQSFAAAMAYIQKDALAAKHAPAEIYAQMHDDELLNEAKKDAHYAAHSLYDLGQQHMVSACMEGIEAASWQISPAQDMDELIMDLHSLFQEIMEMEIEEESADQDEQSIDWQISMLNKCLAASAG